MTHDLENDNRTPALAPLLASDDASVRLKVAMAAGSQPDPAFVDPLVQQCAIEPDFYVRDMLTWALLQQDRAATLARLHPELNSDKAQARSQALHTLSKLAEASTWEWIGQGLLTDPDDEVAKAAWRAAAAVAPESQRPQLADLLVSQLNRGGRETQLSLSRAIASLGEVGVAALQKVSSHPDPAVRAHALATARLMSDPNLGFDEAIEAAKRAAALRGAPLVGDI